MYLFHVAVAICVFSVIQGYPNNHHQNVERQVRPPHGDTKLCPATADVNCPRIWGFRHPRFCNMTHLNPCPRDEICCLSSSDTVEGCCVHENNLMKNPKENSDSGTDEEGDNNQEDEEGDEEEGAVPEREGESEDGEDEEEEEGEPEEEEEKEDPKVTDDPNTPNEETVAEEA